MSTTNARKIPELIVRHRAELDALCLEFGVERLELFGSAATGRFDPETSDLDFVIKFKDEFSLGPWMSTFFELEAALTQLFGREIDLVFAQKFRNPFFQKSVDESRMLLYAA